MLQTDHYLSPRETGYLQHAKGDKQRSRRWYAMMKCSHIHVSTWSVLSCIYIYPGVFHGNLGLCWGQLGVDLLRLPDSCLCSPTSQPLTPCKIALLSFGSHPSTNIYERHSWFALGRDNTFRTFSNFWSQAVATHR